MDCVDKTKKITRLQKGGKTMENKEQKTNQTNQDSMNESKQQETAKPNKNGSKQVKTSQKFKAVKEAAKLAGVIAKLTQHPEWYEGYATDGLVNLNYGKRVGKPIPMHAGSRSRMMQYEQISGVSYGVDLIVPQTREAAFQQSAEIMYSKLRAANSGAINYSVRDLMRYIMNVRSVHALYAMARRLYATLLNVSAFDANRPRALVDANFSSTTSQYEKVLADAANLRMMGDLLGRKIQASYPLRVPLIDRTRWMFSNYFADSNDVKAAFHAFRLSGIPLFIWSNKNDTNTTTAPFTFFDTYENFIDAMQHVCENINDDWATNIIAGDILKCFGQDAIYPAEAWNINFATPFVYDESALCQIENADFAPEQAWSYHCPNDTQAPACEPTGESFFNMKFKQTDGSVYTNQTPYPAVLSVKMVNAWKNDMTPGDTMSAVRFKGARFSEDAGEISVWAFEYISGATYSYGMTDTDTGAYQIASLTSVINKDPGSLSQGEAFMLQVWSQMDHFPLIMFISPYTGLTNTETDGIVFDKMPVIEFLWDLNNFAAATAVDINTLHEYAILSLMKPGNIIKQDRWKAANALTEKSGRS